MAGDSMKAAFLMENGPEMTEVLARLSDVLLKLWPPERILMGMVRHFCSDSDLASDCSIRLDERKRLLFFCGSDARALEPDSRWPMISFMALSPDRHAHRLPGHMQAPS